MTAPVRTTCPYCGVGCGVLASPDGTIAGDKQHPANYGRLCSKGTALGETLSLDGRLLYPEVGGVRADWDTALDRLAGGFRHSMERYGRNSVALYVSGQLLTEDYYAANKLAKGFLGTSNIDSNSRLCMASAVAAHRRAFGEDLVPGTYEDLELADLVVLVGSNLAWCHPVLYQRLVAARQARPDMRIVVIDPRRTATCDGADLHLALRPGTDVALFNGLLHRLDPSQPYGLPLAEAAGICELPATDVARFYEWFAATERSMSVFSQGVNQSSAGADKANAIINCHLVTGRIGRPGMGPFSVTGQPNAMGGREVGALSNMLAAHLEWDRPGDTDLLREYWQAPNLAAGPGLKAVDLFQAVADKRIRALWVMGTNPAVSMPDSDAVRRALAGLDLLAVSDCVSGTETMTHAHVRLPALAWGEKDGTVTNSERVISRQRAFLPVPGRARADWRIVAEVAKRLGFGHAFAWRRPADVFREHAGLSGHRNGGARRFDISALATLSDAGYDAMAPTRWPCPAGEAPAERLLGDGRFPTVDGRARIVPTPVRPPVNAPDAAHGLMLMTGRVRDQWHTMTRTGKTGRLFAHIPEPLVSMNPDDAAAMPDGSLAEVRSRWGRAVFRVRHDAGIRPGTVFAPMHWTGQFCAPARVNATVNPAADPVSGQPELKHTPVSVQPWATDWHGFALARGRIDAPSAAWQAVIPGGSGPWRYEMAGQGPAAEAYAGLHTALSGPGAWITLQDEAAGVFRAARVDDGRLQACVFLGRDHALPPRDWLASLFLLDRIDTAARRALLAGKPASGAAPEPVVCVCHGVDAGTIRTAIRAGCTSLASVGAATKAGTNCGSCRPEINGLLNERVPEHA